MGAGCAGSTVQTDNCYDSHDSRDIRLWNQQAPGAAGNDPCTDIPFLRVFRPDGATQISDVSIIVMLGGGYNELIDKNEQAPVAECFAQKFGITSFVLYYRLV
jgi:hypothetical protein